MPWSSVAPVEAPLPLTFRVARVDDSDVQNDRVQNEEDEEGPTGEAGETVVDDGDEDDIDSFFG